MKPVQLGMKTVQPGKKTVVRAIFRDIHGDFIDPEEQTITLINPWDDRVRTFKPERLDKGIFRVMVEIPKDAEEGFWKVEWTAIIDGIYVPVIEEFDVKKAKLHTARLQIYFGTSPFIITFIGTKGDVEGRRNYSSLLVHHESQRVLVDHGNKELPPNITAVLLTHAHPKHIAGLQNKSLMVPVYLNKFTHESLSREEYPSHRRLFWKKPFEFSDIKVTPVPVLHSVEAPTTGFIFEAKNRKVAYFPNVLSIRNLDALRYVDAYIGDGTSLDETKETSKQGKRVGHASVRVQLQWCKDAGIKRAIFTHLGSWAIEQSKKTLENVAKILSKEFNIEVTFAHDGYRIHMDKEILLQKTLSGVYFLPPHAAQIAGGYKTIIVSSKPLPEGFRDTPLYFIQENRVYGTLKITKEVGPEDSKSVRQNLRDKHLMTDTEWFALYGRHSNIYYYEFKVTELLSKEIQPIKDPTQWIQSVQLQHILKVKEAVISEKSGQRVTLEEVLSHWDEPIVLKTGFIILSDNIASGETEGNINIFQVDDREVPSRDQPILFRLGRALPPDIAERLHRGYIEGHNKMSHVPAFDLVLIPSRKRHLQKAEE